MRVESYRSLFKALVFTIKTGGIFSLIIFACIVVGMRFPERDMSLLEYGLFQQKERVRRAENWRKAQQSLKERAQEVEKLRTEQFLREYGIMIRSEITSTIPHASVSVANGTDSISNDRETAVAQQSADQKALVIKKRKVKGWAHGSHMRDDDFEGEDDSSDETYTPGHDNGTKTKKTKKRNRYPADLLIRYKNRRREFDKNRRREFAQNRPRDGGRFIKISKST